MIQFNITLSIKPELVENCLTWTKEKKIPTIMNSGIFSSYRIAEMIAPIEPEQTGTMYSFQYICNSLDDYLTYEKNIGPAIYAEMQALYGHDVLMFRSVMEIITEGK